MSAKGWLIGVAVVVGLGVGIPLVTSLLSTGASIATAPGRLIQKTLKTDNIIHNYEWFYDYNASYTAKLGQIRTHVELLSDPTSTEDKTMLRIELAAMRQKCRELVTQYNANSQKVNRSIFKGNATPERLELPTCERK